MKKIQILTIVFLISLAISAFAGIQVKAQPNTYPVTFFSTGLGSDATGNLMTFMVTGGSYSGAY